MNDVMTELKRMNEGWAQGSQTDAYEANVIRVRDKVDRYDIRLRNGTCYYDVQGPPGYSYGDSITVIQKGKNKPTIIAKGYRNLNTATEVWV